MIRALAFTTFCSSEGPTKANGKLRGHCDPAKGGPVDTLKQGWGWELAHLLSLDSSKTQLCLPAWDSRKAGSLLKQGGSHHLS